MPETIPMSTFLDQFGEFDTLYIDPYSQYFLVFGILNFWLAILTWTHFVYVSRWGKTIVFFNGGLLENPPCSSLFFPTQTSIDNGSWIFPSFSQWIFQANPSEKATSSDLAGENPWISYHFLSDFPICSRIFLCVSHVFSHLVGGLEPWNFMTFHVVGNFIIPTVMKSYFSEG